MTTGEGSTRWEYRIDVTNIGERAVSLIQVGIMSQRNDLDSSYTTIGLRHEEVEEFPIRLEPHDSRSWTIDGGSYTPSRAEYEPFAQLVQRPTWRERRHGISPARTVFGDWFGSYGPERTGVAPKPRRKKRRGPIAPQPPKEIGWHIP
jgi:hypothetical protein